MSTIFKLIIEDDEGKTTVYPLVDGEVSIGRKEGNTIRLMERNVSRRHARLFREDEAVFLEDLDSYNGVRINGERIASRFRVREGDLIEIGDYHLALQRAAEAEAEAEATQPLDDENDTHDSQEGDPSWPAGTLPDFRLPNDLLSDAHLPRDLGSPAGSPRDTLMDEPSESRGPSRVDDLASAQTLDAAPSRPVAGRPSPAEGLASEASPPSLSDRPTDRPREQPEPRAASLPPFPGMARPDEVLTPRGEPRAEALVREPGEDHETRQLQRGPDRVSDAPRLVCVSTQYAGQEFRLDREELIIGRVEDNDIVIEHRSVSRNHAKVRFDGRTHRIIDLQSANGILVNGEEYAMTNLRSGDLIELGNVRFRFVPSGELFEATGEEAREMRANGIEPPVSELRQRGSEAPPEAAGRAGAYDPSTAATITDAPRSALPEARALSVEPVPGPRVNGESRQGSAAPFARDTLPDDRAATRMDPPPRGASTAATAVVGPSGPPLSDDAGLDGPEPRSGRLDASSSYRPMMFGLIAILAVLVGVLAYLYLMKGDAQLDRQLEEFYNQGNYAEVTAFYEAHEGAFAEEKKVFKLVARAEVKLEQLAAEAGPAAEAPEEARAVAPPPDEPGVEVQVTEEAGRDDEASRSASPARRAGREDGRRSGPRPRIRRLVERGREALTLGDLDQAQRFLESCARRAPRFAACQRMLGVLYGHKQDHARSIRHYQRYLELAPDAQDARNIRNIIRNFEQTESRP